MFKGRKVERVSKPDFIEQFEKQNPYAAIAVDKAEVLPAQALIYAQLAIAYQAWRIRP